MIAVAVAALLSAELAASGGKNAVTSIFECEQPALTVRFETDSQKCHTLLNRE